MKLTLALLLFSASLFAQTPPNLESYQLVILQRPLHPTEYADEKLQEIQKQHLAHLKQMAEAGKLLVAGPLADQPDARMRGIEIFRAASLEEAKKLAEDDPAVKAGRLEVVVMTWYTEKGALSFPIAERLSKK
ncbi:MAG TPA: YciI family protein [Thermoanaerobaculia bacterium]|nr:YciI family protein [Thermoanaerobaculia bacterium]